MSLDDCYSWELRLCQNGDFTCESENAFNNINDCIKDFLKSNLFRNLQLEVGDLCIFENFEIIFEISNIDDLFSLITDNCY